MPPAVAIIAIGNELLNGSIVDSNTAYISTELRQRGLILRSAQLVEDDLPAIVAALTRAAESAELVITTGGLGPTSDDLTREALSHALGEPLERSEPAYEKLRELMERRGRPLNENNLRQVYFPRGAEVLTNPIGTADAFCVSLPVGERRVPIVSLPGVPAEVKKLFAGSVGEWLGRRFSGEPLTLAVIRVFGLSESYIGQCIEQCGMPPEVEVAYRPSFPEITIQFECRSGASLSEQEQILEAAKKRAVEAIGEQFVFAERKDQNFAGALGEQLAARGLTVSVAESCTGGLIANQLVSNAGSSAYFLGGVVSYSDSSKSTFLGVKRKLIEIHGAVSGPVACAMARGIRTRTGADYGVSVTGIAGPDGGTDDKPVGTVWIGLSTTDGEQSMLHHLPWGRSQIRSYSAHIALDLVRRHINGYPLEWEKR